GCAEAGGLDRSPDVRGIPARDPAEDVARGERRLVQEVRDVVGGETELAETMEEIGAVAWPCAAGDVIIGLAAREDDRLADPGPQPGCRQGRRNLGVADGEGNDQEDA